MENFGITGYYIIKYSLAKNSFMCLEWGGGRTGDDLKLGTATGSRTNEHKTTTGVPHAPGGHGAAQAESHGPCQQWPCLFLSTLGGAGQECPKPPIISAGPEVLLSSRTPRHALKSTHLVLPVEKFEMQNLAEIISAVYAEISAWAFLVHDHTRLL